MGNRLQRYSGSAVQSSGSNMSMTQYFFNKDEYKVDLDVYLPTYDINLQREHKWTDKQSEELIRSILMGRFIPSFHICYDIRSGNVIIRIVDGKQRYLAIKQFMDSKIPIDGIYWHDLNKEEKREFWLQCNHTLRATVYHDLTDNQLIDLFHFINFAGTPQDESHLQSLRLAQQGKVT